MKLSATAAGLFLSVSLYIPAAAAFQPTQTPPPKTPATQAPAQPRPRSRPASTAVQVTVRDFSGTPIAFTHLTLSGAVNREVITNQDGVASLPAIADGTYRLRFEHEGFVTLERDLTVKAGQPHELEVTLSAAPAPPPAPKPEAPPPPPKSEPPPAPGGPPVTMSIPAFLDKNFIGREPLKESVLGCTGAATTRLLQLRDPVAVHTHDMDEVLYVVAGDGAVKLRDETTVVHAGSISVVPRGVPHGMERRGKNPLILLSVLAGAPCSAPASTHSASKQHD